MTQRVTIRPATVADASGIATVEVAVYGPYDDPHDDVVAIIVSALRKQETGELPWKTWVAEGAGVLVAFAKCGLTALDELPQIDAAEGWVLNGIAVDPAWRRQGIGGCLVQTRIDWLRERTETVYYNTSLDNHASITLHAPFGFQEYPRPMLTPDRGGAAERRWFRLNLVDH